jgi:hypothetical protein
MKDRIEILQKVANREMTPKEADKELFVLYGVMRSSEPEGLIKHVNGTLRTVIKTNKEDAKEWKDWNLMCLKHCVGQLEKI